jgi:hypothetical protein
LLILLGFAATAAALAVQWRTRFFAGQVPGPTTAAASAIDWIGWLGSPGPLSTAHAKLSGDCQACHVPFRQVADVKCQGCHARDTGLLDRRDTAFHGEATACATCHVEHQGRQARISVMDHGRLRPETACAACHFDRHQARFGTTCETCHRTETWKVAGYRHPSPRSKVCFDCHQPPPSHLMMHFEMMDRMVTGQKDATVEQCYRCHTTDHWNNIKDVGFLKHH